LTDGEQRRPALHQSPARGLDGVDLVNAARRRSAAAATSSALVPRVVGPDSATRRRGRRDLMFAKAHTSRPIKNGGARPDDRRRYDVRRVLPRRGEARTRCRGRDQRRAARARGGRTASSRRSTSRR
jgi:hypothetical protein